MHVLLTFVFVICIYMYVNSFSMDTHCLMSFEVILTIDGMYEYCTVALSATLVGSSYLIVQTRSW